MNPVVRIAFRAVCVGLLALPLATPAPLEAATAKHRKAPVKGKQAAKKQKSVAGKSAKPKKKPHPKAKKPVAHKPHATTVHRQSKPQPLATARPRPMRIAALAPRQPIRAVPAARPARAPEPVDAASEMPTPVVREESEVHGAKAACRRDGKIYLLADCDAPLPLTLATSMAGEPQ